MKDSLLKWLNSERLGRVEAGTSQDMAPTNGALLFMYVWFSSPFILMGIVATILHFGFGIPWVNVLSIKG